MGGIPDAAQRRSGFRDRRRASRSPGAGGGEEAAPPRGCHPYAQSLTVMAGPAEGRVLAIHVLRRRDRVLALSSCYALRTSRIRTGKSWMAGTTPGRDDAERPRTSGNPCPPLAPT